MNDTVNNATTGETVNADETNTNANSYPEIMSVQDLKADPTAFMANVGEASEGIPAERQFRNFDNPEQLPDDFQVVIDPRDSGSFAKDKNGAALFTYAMPTFEAIAAMGDAGKEFIKDCVESVLARKAAAYATGVNRENGAFNMPLDVAQWLETAKPASSGVRALSKKGWTAVNGALVDAINALYKKNNHPLRISKKDLTHCMSDAKFAEASHPAIKNWDNIFARAEALIAEKVKTPDMVDVDGVQTPVVLDAVKDTAILKKWKETREQSADMPEMEITDLEI